MHLLLPRLWFTFTVTYTILSTAGRIEICLET